MEVAVRLLQEVKQLVNLETNESMDDTLKIIITNVYNRLLTRTGYEEVPEALLWIVVEVSCSRYNKLGSEGIHTELNEGIQFIYDRDLFAEYQEDIDRYVQNNPPTNRKRFRMI